MTFARAEKKAMAEADVFDIEIQNNDTSNSNQKTNSDSDEEPLEIQEVKHKSTYILRCLSFDNCKKVQTIHLPTVFSQQLFSHLIALYENTYNFFYSLSSKLN